MQEQRGQQHGEYGLYAIDNGGVDRRGEVQTNEYAGRARNHDAAEQSEWPDMLPDVRRIYFQPRMNERPQDKCPEQPAPERQSHWWHFGVNPAPHHVGKGKGRRGQGQDQAGV